MALIPTRDLLATALSGRKALAAFNVVHLETAEALVAAGEETGMPVILQISENCINYHGGLLPLARATMALARQSNSPVAVHLDHAENENLAYRAIDLGFGSVMFDGAKLPYAENVAATTRVAQYAHAREVAVEAELGEIGGKDGAHAPGVRTDPIQAQSFSKETGVDLLAVAVGSSHAMSERSAKLDFALIARLREAVGVPLVLHGSSGVADSDIRTAINAGITKVNISTQLNRHFTAAVRECLAGDLHIVDSRIYLRAARDAVQAESARLLRLCALVDESSD